MLAIRDARHKLTTPTWPNKVRTVLSRKVVVAADADTMKVTEVLMFREKPIG